MTDLAVIMSIYKNDRLEFVKQSIQSILDQTFAKFHYYIIFDGPVQPDIETYVNSLTDNRIQLFSLDKNKGLATALNYLLEKVMRNPEYRFIARMDADDISLRARFEIQRDFLLTNREVTIAGCWYEEIDDDGKVLSYKRLPKEHDALLKRYYTRAPFVHSSVMFTKRLIEAAGYYPTDTILMEDSALWGKAFKYGLRFSNISEYLFKFRKDKDFYKRRSGLRYGWNYIKTRFKIIKPLKLPVYTYLLSFGIGIVKMMPALFVRNVYSVTS